ncbi:TetR/AcrR family transcriptional regulator [Companilactobacillus sp.]|jgi:AcrR family transcriptional regulator|uniref:TetR/AcrR family transcriptional regulator n=1 Tax=Companilactobacillus sp. TaxID=2767905 RepID=UPI0025C23E57|nr:TetR/AcrR family transcriptional regulator [Companilactobacillus sp.]MCH4009069.1 TetR/AcrR family transcriptional regulator [Companilactobacillus sp.]MCH4050752.1 TetR/AcrR family transcriptional regulator [Companilactobacillus sp.]MCH4077011.1 TetR/AcrR family transcriptional regulator [Companilactobacillus sp.]MCH4125587.1 TetR/AcrR family transcriptional regulator [Companilactobacillus sp.]MCI1311296.1 TetR/AcrR family transcriptional regulator [Companilactobacillus sp.]
MDGNERRKKLKRQAIMNAATEMFVTNGYTKTSVQQIAKKANSSQVTLYKYFPSKADLAREVVLSLVVDGYAHYEKQLDDPTKPFIDKMKVMMEKSVGVSDQMNDDFFRFMIDEFQGRNGDTHVMEEYDRLKYGFWRKLLAQGRTEHVVSDELSDYGAMIYLDMYVKYVMQPGGVSVERATQMKKHEKELVHLFFYGIIGQ